MAPPSQTHSAPRSLVPVPAPRSTHRVGAGLPEWVADASLERPEIPAEAVVALRDISHPDVGCARAMATHLHRRLPDLDRRSVAGSAFDETRACCQAHLELVVRVMSKGASTAAVAVPDEAIEHARSLIRRGVSLDVLLRTYHLGQAFLNGRAAARLQHEAFDDALRLRATVAVDAFLFEYIDRVSGAIAAIYRDERETWRRSPDAVRAEALRAILEQRGVDERRLEQRLGYELSGFHTAMVLSSEGQERGFEDLRVEAQRFASALGACSSLVVRGEGGAAWAWCRSLVGGAEDAMRLDAEWRPVEGVQVAFAGPALGVDGFRVAHLEALETVEFVGRFSCMRGPRGVTSYRSVEVVAMLAQDHERAVRFMRSRLGSLAGPDARLRDLRQTALGFLRHNRSHARAGEALFLHKNTIFARIKRAEKLLGARSDTWGFELEAALVLASVLGGEC